MDKLVKLGQDMVLLWQAYRPMYMNGIWSTLGLALIATVIGCIIGLICGMGETGIDHSGITCKVVGDDPEAITVTVSGAMVTLKFAE